MLENLDPRWHFPLLNGLLTGADGGSSASNFRGDPIKAIGKENLQNPIDARQDDLMPARVEFNVFFIPAAQFPGRDALELAIKQAKVTAKPEGNSREESFYTAAEKYIETLKNGSHKPNQILRDLYDLGVIGNYGKVPRFVFKGDRDIDPMAPLTIHYPLIRFFRAAMRNYKSSN